MDKIIRRKLPVADTLIEMLEIAGRYTLKKMKKKKRKRTKKIKLNNWNWTTATNSWVR